MEVVSVALMTLLTLMYRKGRSDAAAPEGYVSRPATRRGREGASGPYRYRYEVGGQQYQAEHELSFEDPVVHYDPAAPGDAPVVVHSYIEWLIGVMIGWLILAVIAIV